jgi:uncharacterized protein (TIGR03118 family)
LKNLKAKKMEKSAWRNQKVIFSQNRSFAAIVILFSFITMGCNDSLRKQDFLEKDLSKMSVKIPIASDYRTVVLVADATGFNAGRIDENLGNAWGIAINPNGPVWISANHTGKSVIYDANGNQLRAAVNIPLGANLNGASPTGVIFNGTPDFVIPGKGKSLFVFATEDGILSAWNASLGASSMTVVDNSASGAVYKGIAWAVDGGDNFIYATDFHNAKIDVFDKDFAMVTTKPFMDPNIPSGFAPFNIRNINGKLWVTYAKQLAPDNHDDQAGVGNGYVDIYNPDGTLVKRFASQGLLNSPWGIEWAANFGQIENAILIGNFGDGHVNVYNLSGDFQGQVKEKGKPLTIDGLWAITFDPVLPADLNRLYFTAGPEKESHGIFGYINAIKAVDSGKK